MTDNATSDCIIETVALSKRYGDKLALDHLDLRIPRGRIHAIVGANGAGKSTLFRILLGFLPPTSGQARILGRDSQQLRPDDRGRIATSVLPKPTSPQIRRSIGRAEVKSFTKSSIARS